MGLYRDSGNKAQYNGDDGKGDEDRVDGDQGIIRLDG